jgi:hypothetical protein
MVKSSVQSSSLGLLKGNTGLSYIQVHYLTQDSSSSTGVTDVSSHSTGNAPGNIMQVSINNFPLPALMPRVYGLAFHADSSATNLTVVSADQIGASGDVPPIGTAP